MIGNVGGYEILVIAIVALIAVGPEQLPSVMRKVGRAAAQLRGMASGMRDEFMAGVNDMNDLTDPDAWLGSGSDDDPIVPRGYAQRQQASGTTRPLVASNGAADRDVDGERNDPVGALPSGAPPEPPPDERAASETAPPADPGPPSAGTSAGTPSGTDLHSPADGDSDEPAGSTGSRA